MGSEMCIRDRLVVEGAAVVGTALVVEGRAALRVPGSSDPPQAASASGIRRRERRTPPSLAAARRPDVDRRACPATTG